MKTAMSILLAAALLWGCKEELAEAPPPAPLNEESVGFFCQMEVLGHGGPKAQIHLEGMPAPLFFVQVRDGVAYMKSPERDARITATYVSDMGATSWNEPGETNWIAAKEAVFVIEANVAGGMGAPETVPFRNVADAEAFVDRYGGRLVGLGDIPDDAVLAPVDTDAVLEVPE